MQARFAFCGQEEIGRWCAALAPLAADVALLPRRRPVGQLVKSLISGRTRDAVSLRAYRRLGARYGCAARIAEARPRQVRRTIADVNFADAKAGWLVAALEQIGRERPGFALDFLGAMPVEDALAWLERLPGVGREVAASTLNASTLDRPVFIVDSHVLRVATRLGLADSHAGARTVSEIVTAAMAQWRGEDFLRFHIACKRLGQRVCRPEAPDCTACPLRRDCRHACD